MEQIDQIMSCGLLQLGGVAGSEFWWIGRELDLQQYVVWRVCIGEFTREESDLDDDVYMGDNPKARTRPPLLGGAFGRDGTHLYVETRPHTLVPLHLTPIRSHFTPLHLTLLHSISPLLYAHLYSTL
jgi:hypothetical protein